MRGKPALNRMKKIPVILFVALLLVAGNAAWQIGAAELANANLQEEIRDMAAQAGANIGLATRTSDDDVVQAVIGKARSHGIELEPSQVTVRRTDSGPKTTLYLAADYTTSVKLLFLTLNFHFTPSSER
jgi:hypothetical protein